MYEVSISEERHNTADDEIQRAKRRIAKRETS